MKKYLRVLRKCPLFSTIEDDSLLRMLVCLGAKIEFFDKKYTILGEGTPAKYIGIVLSGAVQVFSTDIDGAPMMMANVGEGDSFGESLAYLGTEEPTSYSGWRTGFGSGQ